MISKYSVSNTMETPTTFTVITRHMASFKEFHTNDGMEPARKNLITASGSVFPALSFAVNMEVSVLMHGITINPRKR